jgi:hypothetical protein
VPVVIEPVQRFQRLVGVAELAIVVVLDDGGVVSSSPGQQGHASPQGHRYPGWELVGGRDVDQPGVVRQGVDDQALDVDRHPEHLRPV